MQLSALLGSLSAALISRIEAHVCVGFESVAKQLHSSRTFAIYSVPLHLSGLFVCGVHNRRFVTLLSGRWRRYLQRRCFE